MTPRMLSGVSCDCESHLSDLSRVLARRTMPLRFCQSLTSVEIRDMEYERQTLRTCEVHSSPMLSPDRFVLRGPQI